MVKNVRSEPWFELYQSYVSSLNFESRLERRWAYRLARKQYRLDHSKGVSKLFYKSSKWVVATGFIGQLNDELASKFESITGYSKKYSQDWNVPWSSINHVVFVSGGIDAVMAGGYDSFVSKAGTWSLYVTVPFAVFCLGWNVYRLANRDDKARPALGYEGLATMAVFYLKKNSAQIKNFVKSTFDINHPGIIDKFNINEFPLDWSGAYIIEDKSDKVSKTNMSSGLEQITDKYSTV
ncbi:MAG: hypothetical protein ACP5N3_02740 [Candidatus Nanoarchaeia archaeon]